MPLIITVPEQYLKMTPGTCDRPVGLIDMYPTLVELCGLSTNERIEGRSLVPLLKDSQAEWKHLTLTSYGPGNHALQSERYRFYQYEDGSTELYDQQSDPNEWINLASNPDHAKLIEEFRRSLPQSEAKSSKYNKYPTNRYFLKRFR